MMREKNKKTALIVLAAIVIVSVFTVNAVAAQNLLTNPGAETGDMSGWTIIANGGNGWSTRGSGYEGTHSFSTSYNWCKRSQEIDLLAKGYTEAQLDATPIVNVGEWFAGYGSAWDDPNHHRDYCYLKVELRDVNHNLIDSYDSGVFQTKNGTGWYGPWEQRSHTFSGYGSGLRYIYFEDGGDDWEFWNGHYGPALDAASVTITVPVSVPAMTPIGILALVGLLSIIAVSRIPRREK
jgi:hypothetical protein